MWKEDAFMEEVFIKKRFSGELALILGIVINSFSVALFLKSNAGMSTISLTSYILNLVFPVLTIGTWNYLIQWIMIGALILILRKVKVGYLLSFVLAIIFGTLLDFFHVCLQGLPDGIGFRIFYFIFAFSMCAIGTTFLIRCKIPVLPSDTFMRDVSNYFHTTIKMVKTPFDVFCLILSAVLGFLYTGEFPGIGIGTVINAFFGAFRFLL